MQLWKMPYYQRSPGSKRSGNRRVAFWQLMNRLPSVLPPIRLGNESSLFLCNGLKQLELLAIDRWKDDWKDDSFEKAFEAGTGVHRRGNLDVRLLFLLLRIQSKV